MKVDVFKIPMNAPNDLTGLQALIEDQKSIDPKTIVAIMGKTEGNGCVNDFTRGFAVATLQHYLNPLINDTTIANRIVYVMSGGTEGVLSPHLTVYTRKLDESDRKDHARTTVNEDNRLVLGVHHTRNFTPDEIGTLSMVQVVADGVKQAMVDANHVQPHDVHFVQIKCPLLTASSLSTTTNNTITQDSYKSMAYSRGASALGVAVALGEIELAQISPHDICSNYNNLYSSVASTSAGVELKNCEILVLGNAQASTSHFRIGHSVMQHALDVDAVSRAMKNAHISDKASIVNVLAKAEASPSGKILGRRHTMMDDSDINHTRMARAVVGAVVAAAVQDPMIYVSGGAEHQGPEGGGPLAVICRLGGTDTF
jgi:cyanuric acid amidohydrolase